MSHDKFLVFLEALTTEDNKGLIEAITEGYKSILESKFGMPDEFRFRSEAKGLEGRLAKVVDGLQIQAEKMGESFAIDDLDSIVGAYKQGKMELAQKLYERLPITLKDSSLGQNLGAMLYI